MPTNPYDPAQLRQAQMAQLGQAPTATTMPTGQRSRAVAPIGAPAPSGFDAKNWADPNMQTVKYGAGRLLHGLSKPSEVGQRVQSADFQGRFPGATFDGKDKIDFRGALSEGDSGEPVGLIDVLMGADPNADSSNGMWWGYDAEGTGASPNPNPAMPLAPMAPNGPEEESAVAKILRELNATKNGQQSPTEREAIMQMLQV